MSSLNLLWRICVFACLASAFPWRTQADGAAPAPPELVFQVILEQRHGDQWQSVDTQTVFHGEDQIRFRFRSSLGGYLYVLDRASDDHNAWLFPRPESEERSRVEPGPEYLVPGGRGFFVVEGKPGFDITYWILSPVPVNNREFALPPPGTPPSTLQPRCREELLRARGLCQDNRAGPQPLTSLPYSPIALPRGTTLVARDLKFHTQEGKTSISAPRTEGGVIVYEIRIAHN